MTQKITPYQVVLVTVSDKEEAEYLAHKLLEAKLVACANILDGVNSFFRWQGAIDHASECLMVLKTKVDLFDDLKSAIKNSHSYDVPEIIALPIINGNKDYLDWIEDSLQ
ncbi:MAG: divalent-cation tolerance protein CutA [Candidatus Omnitrophica bacterium]|nr:divalent-cation tolerance protein CutA [Candidatus Omnitrophota bacterium]